MLLEHSPRSELVQGTHIQQVWRRAEGKDISVLRQQPVLDFVLSTNSNNFGINPKSCCVRPHTRAAKLTSPLAQMQVLSPLAFLCTFLSQGLKFPG